MTCILLTAILVASGTVAAHGDTAVHAAPKTFDAARVESTPFGQEGDPANVTRTIRVAMDDRMRFVPGTISVRKGETVRFVVENKGGVLHEMVLGTPQALREHAALMRKHPGMEHDEPHMAHVKPRATGAIVWQFTQPGEFRFACLVPGHFEAGMHGKVIVK
jgi:uncharacterized cupredoxin-like copper-binding protein